MGVAQALFGPRDMAVRVCEVLARPWVGVRVCHLLLLLAYKILLKSKIGLITIRCTRNEPTLVDWTPTSFSE